MRLESSDRTPASLSGAAPEHRFAVPGLRWVMAGLLLLASILNYIDRQALSILATTIQAELGLTDREYARIVQAFLFFYGTFYLLSGRIVDRYGPRIAETFFMTWWSVANMLTGLASGFYGFLVCRSLLGMGEPGNYAASAKVVAEWFPPREKGAAVGIYVMGGTLGAALAAPLLAVLATSYGWRAAFVVTGGAGLVLAMIWFALYRGPDRHPLLGARERDFLSREGVIGRSLSAKEGVSVRRILGYRPLWLIVGCRMVTDPLWYFYLFWLAKYFQEERGYTLDQIGARLWVVFLAADLGCLLGGWLSGRLAKGDRSVVNARLMVMAGAAAVLAFGFLIPLTPGPYAPLALASVCACAALAFMTNATTLPVDIFAPGAMGSVQGVIGTGGAVGGLVTTGLVGWMVSNYSYATVFTAMSFLHPLTIVALWLWLPRAVEKHHASTQADENLNLK